jgi:NADH-quinone oxidoreductase subunit J
MVLFMFVIMLLGAEQVGTSHLRKWFLPLAILLGAVLLLETAYILFSNSIVLPNAAALSSQFGSPQAIGSLLFNQYILPFEVTSILLLVAMIGAIVLTKRLDEPQKKGRDVPPPSQAQTEKS